MNYTNMQKCFSMKTKAKKLVQHVKNLILLSLSTIKLQNTYKKNHENND